jgi:hypothetical protein
MGIRAEIRDELKKEMITKIHGQPTSHDLTILEKEIIAILANIPMALGGGKHGHAGIIMEPTIYPLMTGGTAFVIPVNPGIYPTGLAANAAPGTRARAEAEHKELINQFEAYEGVKQGTKDIILQAVDNEYLAEIEHETLGYLNQTPRQMLDHLFNQRGMLDFANTKELLAERDGEWNVNKNPQLYFNRVEKAVKGLIRCGILSDLNEQRDMALYYLKAASEFDAACREWEAKPAAKKTWQNIKTFISAEYAKENKQNKLTAKHFKANMMEEQAEATEGLIATLMEMHSHQIETLIKNTTNAMKEMMLLIKENKNPTNSNKSRNEEKKKKKEENQNRYNDAPICKNCRKKHPLKAKDECWEVEKNKASRPSMWKSIKST